MSEPNSSQSAISEDEQRLVRLFRCLTNEARTKTLQRLGNRLMMEAAIDLDVSSFKSPEEAAREELQEEIDDRLKRLMPVHCVLVDLLDYDYDVTEYGWRDASISIAEVILGSGENDDEFADMLVDAYLQGANRYDVPLPCDFAEPEISRAEAVQDMRQYFQQEALTFIKKWRENVIRQFEQAP
jgi:hypothetical protein